MVFHHNIDFQKADGLSIQNLQSKSMIFDAVLNFFKLY